MGKLNVSRRTFAKLAAATAAATALSATAGSLSAIAEEDGAAGEIKKIRSLCRCCGKM